MTDHAVAFIREVGIGANSSDTLLSPNLRVYRPKQLGVTSAGALSEPRVLAHASRRVIPDADVSGTAFVADTQFVTEWFLGWAISSNVRENPVPFNLVRTGAEHPDLVGEAIGSRSRSGHRRRRRLRPRFDVRVLIPGQNVR